MQDFERQKKSLDYEEYIRKDKLVTLHGRGTQVVLLEPEMLKDIFGVAFDTGLKALREELRCVFDLKKSFVVLFLGGSYMNPGLYNKVKVEMEEWVARGRSIGVTIKYAFLSDFENRPYVTVTS